MLVYTGSVVGSKTEVLCSVCSKVVGAFTQKEIAKLVHNLDAIYCFECDSVNADTVHPALYDPAEPFLLCIDGTWIGVNPWKELRAKDMIITQKNMTIESLFDRLSLAYGGKS